MNKHKERLIHKSAYIKYEDGTFAVTKCGKKYINAPRTSIDVEVTCKRCIDEQKQSRSQSR